MLRGSRAHTTPIWEQAKQASSARKGKDPAGGAGPLNRNPMGGDHLLGSFGRLMGGIAGAIYVSEIMHVNE